MLGRGAEAESTMPRFGVSLGGFQFPPPMEPSPLDDWAGPQVLSDKIDEEDSESSSQPASGRSAGTASASGASSTCPPSPAMQSFYTTPAKRKGGSAPSVSTASPSDRSSASSCSSGSPHPSFRGSLDAGIDLGRLSLCNEEEPSPCEANHHAPLLPPSFESHASTAQRARDREGEASPGGLPPPPSHEFGVSKIFGMLLRTPRSSAMATPRR